MDEIWRKLDDNLLESAIAGTALGLASTSGASLDHRNDETCGHSHESGNLSARHESRNPGFEAVFKVKL